MQFTIQNAKLTPLLNFVIGVVEKKQVLPILSHVLFSIKNNQLKLTASDLELELVCSAPLDTDVTDAEISLPARKLFDICKSLSGESQISFNLKDNVIHIAAESAKFSLMTLPASQFPQMTEQVNQEVLAQFNIKQSDLKASLERVAFAMAMDDFRYYLNGTLIELIGNKISFVATDTHRLAYTEQQTEQSAKTKHRSIVPRKAVTEMIRLLAGDDPVEVKLFDNSIKITNNVFTFTSKLLEGQFPNYQAAIPEKNDQTFVVDTLILKNALTRATLLLDQKAQALHLQLVDNQLKILASNSENEQSEEILAIDYNHAELQISYNASYLRNVLDVIETAQVQICIADNRSAMVEEVEGDQSFYLIMPIRD